MGKYGLELIFQPPNSPDLNVLDLGFFCSIQGLQKGMVSKNLEVLVENTERAFREQSWEV